MTLPVGVFVPIGPSRPTAAQESAATNGDIEFSTSSGEAYLQAETPFSKIAPYDGVPTYQGCSLDLDLQISAPAGQGSAFCLYESYPARTVGGIVTYINPAAINPDSVTVELTVWSGSS